MLVRNAMLCVVAMLCLACGSTADDTTTNNGAKASSGTHVKEDKRMPDVVCMNLQDAQDEIQKHGVFYSKSRDATGQARHQIIDSNWHVLDQTPEPGATIDEGTAILFVVKYGEEDQSKVGNPC